MFEHNYIVPLIQGFVAFTLIALGAYAIIVIAYVVIDILRDSKQYQRKQILKNYRKAEAHIQHKLALSNATGVLYSKGVIDRRDSGLGLKEFLEADSNGGWWKKSSKEGP